MTNLDDPLFHTLFETPVPRIIIKANTPVYTIVACNDAFKKTTYTDGGNINGRSLWEVYDPKSAGNDQGNILSEAIAKAIETNQPVHLPRFNYHTPSAGLTQMAASWWQFDIMPICGADGKPEYLLITTNNIAGKYFAQQAIDDGLLKEQNLTSELKFKLISTNEELAAINEELRSTNEELVQSRQSLQNLNTQLEARVQRRTHELQKSQDELQAMNEELKATIEELAATNEEMFASNEELYESQNMLRGMILEISESESRFRFMLNAIPQQVWTAKPNGELDYVNKVVCDNFGQTVQSIIGHGWQAFIHPDDLPGCLQKWLAALETGSEYVVEFRLLFVDGVYRWHLGRATPLIEDGKIKLWLGTNTNIDLQKDNEQKKDEFLSIASHELKTPLTTIKAFNQLMQKTTDIGKMTRFAAKSSEPISRLERLISDLLDVTKLNAGRLNYNIAPFNFQQMVSNCVETVQLTAPTHQIHFHGNADIDFVGDNFRLEQVMVNFLTNAIKYSPGQNNIIVKCHNENDSIFVSVQDFGIGIAEDQVDKLFDRYFRIDQTAMRYEGLGLGLYISSNIIQRHGGKFWIESKKGEGSTFHFSLPLNNHEVNVEPLA